MRYAAIVVAALTGCAGPDFVTGTNLLTGTYSAAIFRVTPSGQPQVDVLAAGGSLVITIQADAHTTGALHVPASVTGEGDFTASMEGTAMISGLTVEFDQAADTFVRDLVWLRVEGSLIVTDQTVGGATYNILLSRLETR